MAKKKDELVSEAEKIKAELDALKKKKEVLDSKPKKSKAKKTEAKPAKKTTKKAETKPTKKTTKKAETKPAKKTTKKAEKPEKPKKLTKKELEEQKTEEQKEPQDSFDAERRKREEQTGADFSDIQRQAYDRGTYSSRERYAGGGTRFSPTKGGASVAGERLRGGI